MRGDIHDMGKSLVGTMLRALSVVDLGAGVLAQRIFEEGRRTEAEVVGLSVLLTPMVRRLRATVEVLSEAGLCGRVRVVVGGACARWDPAEVTGSDAPGPSDHPV
jgi:5-methyltetrahydrofolate--homocysteine methyltransferase